MAAELVGPGKSPAPSKDEVAGLGPRTDRPHLNATIDLSQHKLSPTEGFVLSRVDGHMSYDEICMVSGLGRDETLRILREFKQARLILGRGKWPWGHRERDRTRGTRQPWRLPLDPKRQRQPTRRGPSLRVYRRQEGRRPQSRRRWPSRGARWPNLRLRGRRRRPRVLPSARCNDSTMGRRWRPRTWWTGRMHLRS